MIANTNETLGERGGWHVTVRWVCDCWQTGETGVGNSGQESLKSVESSTLRMRKLCKLYSVYLHPKPLRMTTPFIHPGGHVWGSTIYRNEFPWASRGRAT